MISIAQLRLIGLSTDAIKTRRGNLRIAPVHRGVYAVGHSVLTREGRWMAAVLAGGDAAVLSHLPAAELWDLCRSPTGPIDVTIPGGCQRRAGIRFHRSSLPGREVTRRNGIPLTTPARTLLDLAAVLTAERLRRAVEQAETLRHDFAEVRAVIAAHPHRRGSRLLADVLADVTEPEPTRSELEDRFLDVCALHGIPRPRVNVRVLDYEVDFLWPKARLIVEADGRRWHGTASAFETDRARDARLTVAGYTVLRFTYRRIQQRPAEVAAAIASLLARHG